MILASNSDLPAEQNIEQKDNFHLRVDGCAIRQKIIIRRKKETRISCCWSAKRAVKLMADIPEKEMG